MSLTFLAFDVASILVLDAFLAVVTWFLIAGIWNNAVREKFKVRSYLAWSCLLGIVVAIANAVTIVDLSPIQGVPTASLFILTLLVDALLAAVTALLVILIWNAVMREELKVVSNVTWTVLLGTVIAIANAVATAILW